MKIEKFKPFEFEKSSLNIEELNSETGKSWEYAAPGKAALYHCLRSLKVTGTVLIPVYVCQSILKPISDLNLKYECYDINKEDLNINIQDLEDKLNKNKDITCVLIASMYGNPRQLKEAKKICKSRQVLLIDDAAQSFGAFIDNKLVGTYGDAGLFSFSPGKATPRHIGAFFWTTEEGYSINMVNNYLLHRLAYLNYYFNRYKLCKYKKYKFFLFCL